MEPATQSALTVRMLGRMSVGRDGCAVELPSSRKLIGLFAYVTLAPRAVSRARLCELLWDVPNDPRSELRWCLSKIRRVIDQPGRRRVVARGDAVEFDLSDCFVDAIEIERAAAEGIDAMPRERIDSLVRLFDGEFLEGLEIDRCPLFENWLVAERRRFRDLQVAMLEHLTSTLPDNEAIEHLDRWLEVTPFDSRPHARMLSALARMGRIRDAEEHFESTVRAFADEGIDVAPVRIAWQQVRSRGLTVTTPSLAATPVESGLREVQSAPLEQGSPGTAICVLPFVNISGDPEQEYFSDGITEDIITDLGKVSALFVIARNTAFTFKGRNVDVSQVARELGVTHVLEGSVRRAGNRVRITGQLIDGATGGHVWAERYDRELTDIFALQDEIAGAIVAALKLRLLPGEKTSIERRGTTDLNAYDLFLRGTRPAFGANEQRARIELLESATRIAPDYANAWGALANARATWRLELPYADRGEVAVAVLQEALRALALDPRNVDALAAQVLLLPPFGRYLEAEALTERMNTVAGETGDAHAAYVCNLWRARHYVTVGRMRDTVDASRRAFEIDPLDPIVTNLWGRNLTYAGRFEEGKRILVDLLARWPDNHYAAMSLFGAAVATEDWATADTLLDPERLAKYPLREFEAWCRWYALVMREPPPRSCELVVRAIRKRFQKSGLADFLQLQLAAKVGAIDEAYEIALRGNFGPPGTRDDRMGIDAYKTLTLFNVAFPEFRRDPRFVHLCARCGLVDYWIATAHWPDCVDEVASYYDFRRECEAVASGPPVVRADRVV